MRVGRWEAGQDFYATLGIDRGASEATIRRAHRKLVLEHHPDRPGREHGTEERIKRVNLAASVLLDPSARARYDHMRSEGAQPRPVAPPAATKGASPRRTPPEAPRTSPFVGRGGAFQRGGGVSARLFAFAFVATVAIGCIAHATPGPVPVSSPQYRIPAPPRMATLWLE